ncbi:MAG TPA: GGDEF domain-containing protein [Gammaproteobacteria bacterium]|nr:GGDEF domain-containing protein [Gammaproteobacteria bacterium]
MRPDEAGALISYLGLISQTAGAGLLIVLFQLLRSHGRRRSYFTIWGNAWIALTVALVALTFAAVREMPDLHGRVSDVTLTVYWLIYQLGKFCYYALLFTGTWIFVSGHQPPRLLAYALGFAAACALASWAFSPDLNMLVRLQTPLAIAASGGCAWLLMSLPPSRRSPGTRITGLLFVVIAAAWLLYAWAFDIVVPPAEGTWQLFIVQYHSFLDLLLQFLLAFGMVLILLEDAKRETDAAHRELAVAHQKLLDEAVRDPLTGAYNRRAFMQGVGLEQVKASFGTVVVFDLDNLKRVNDAHGHAVGDAMLIHLVNVLRAGLRPTDKLYRWGGDEFLLIMPRALAAEVVPRLRERIDNAEPLAVASLDLTLKLEASLGASDYAGAEQLEAAIQRADGAMYEDKRIHKTSPRTDPNAMPASDSG